MFWNGHGDGDVDKMLLSGGTVQTIYSTSQEHLPAGSYNYVRRGGDTGDFLLGY
jgi:hypothetical protein